MRDTAEPDWMLLADYLSADATPETIAKVEQWIDGNPERRALVDNFRTVWETTGRFEPLPFGLAAIERTVLSRITPAIASAAEAGTARPAVSKSSRPAQQRKNTRTVIMRLGFVSAALAGVVALASVGAWGHWRSSSARHTAVHTYTTTTGQQATLVLADGSRAVLGPASRIDVSGDSASGMTVSVQGKVLFSVAHSARAPFVVNTSNSVTRVLGTTFFVRRYPNDRTTQVVVTEGRVSLHGMHASKHVGEPKMLSATTLGIADDSGQIRVVPNINTEDYTSWAIGRLDFHNTAARDIITEVGRTYGVAIQMTDTALANHVLNWSVSTANTSLSETLDELCGILDAHIERSNGVLHIVPGRPPRRPAIRQQVFTPETNYGR